jgi:hypothetical protein
MPCQAKETYLSQKTLFKDNIQDDSEYDQALLKDVADTLALKRLTQCECLIVKNIASTTKSPEAKTTSITKHKGDFQRETKQNAGDCVFKPIWKEVEIIMGSGSENAAEKPSVASSSSSKAAGPGKSRKK